MIKNFVVRIEKVHPGSSLKAGVVFEPIEGRVLIGRADTADVQLKDISVSRQHALIESTETGFCVQNLTDRGSTFVNAEPLGPRQSVEIEAGRAWLQIGQALLEVSAVTRTARFSNVMSLPMSPAQSTSEGPFIKVQHQPFLRIWVGGQLVSLFPSAARVLAKLCETPCEAVLQEELLEAIDPEFHLKAGGANLHQNMTYIRDMFSALLDSDQVSEETLRALIEAASPKGSKPLTQADRRGLLRAVLANVRGVGYCLRLPPERIAVER